jgi:hypothetical protein
MTKNKRRGVIEIIFNSISAIFLVILLKIPGGLSGAVFSLIFFSFELEPNQFVIGCLINFSVQDYINFVEKI